MEIVDNNILDIAKELEFNQKAEAEAREYYYNLLKLDLLESDKERIRDIIDDEINHSIILMRLAEKYTCNKPTEYESLLSLKKIKKEMK